MLLMDVTVVTVALPQMRADLSASLPGLQWVINAYALTLAACQLTAGSLGDRFGRRRLFIAGIGLFAAASAGCAAAPGAAVLIGLRVVQGVGGAVMFTTSLALVADCYQGAAAGDRVRDPRSDQRLRGRCRPPGGRAAHYGAELAVDLRAEPAAGGARRGAHARHGAGPCRRRGGREPPG
jgi:MFS family permease